MDADIVTCLYSILLLTLLSAVAVLFRCIVYPFLHILWYVVKYKIKTRWQSYRDRPVAVKNNLLKFKYGPTVYQVDLKNSMDPSRLELTVITDGYKDVSQRVLSLAGPFGNFFGIKTTPRSLGYSCLYIDHVHFYGSDDELPALDKLVD
jgi:hypothetical protein